MYNLLAAGHILRRVFSRFTMSAPENSSTPYVGHRPHPTSSSGPVHHHYLVNFAVSIAAVLFGILIIAAFALAISWRKRSTQRYLLETRIGARIPQSSISDVSDGRSTISLKFFPPGLPPPEDTRNRLPFLPAAPPHAHHPTPHARPLHACQSCTSGLNNRPPCYCPTCPNGPSWDNPPAYRASPTLGDAIASPRSHPTLAVRNNASPPRPTGTDENVIRRNSQRTPPAQIVGSNGHVRSVQDSPTCTPVGHAQESAVAGDSAISCSSGSSSLTVSPSSASAASASPPLVHPFAGSPPLQLSDDAGATTLGHGRGLDVITSRVPLGLAVSCGQSDATFAHIRVTPPSQDGLDTLSDGAGNGEQTTVASRTPPSAASSTYPSGSSSSTAAVEGRIPLRDGSYTAGITDTSRASAAGRKPEKWFTDVDWLGEQGTLADHSEHPLAPGSHCGQAI
ncbi:hypothetical protein LXA43DRAFT_526778 [Ganoderma leucocontextum]|nr:hypothetical protein LXA43DRAFT_526778 [Ganoderma leucocontextum]